MMKHRFALGNVYHECDIGFSVALHANRRL
jgi:hypothetical protein